MDVVCVEEQLFSVLAEEIAAPIGIDLPCGTKHCCSLGMTVGSRPDCLTGCSDCLLLLTGVSLRWTLQWIQVTKVSISVSSHCSVVNFTRLRVI